MAKTMAHFIGCNVKCAEMHNSRNEQYIACVNASPRKKYSLFSDDTCNNSTWINEKYKEKTLPQLLDDYRKLYSDQVGQKPQENDRVRQYVSKKTGMLQERILPGWAPIREGIVPVTADTQTKDFMPFVNWLKEKGVDVIRIDIHQDEGHIDPMTGDKIYNRHAHVIASWIDPETGRTRKLSKKDASDMQDEIAKSLGMERGTKKELTGADHLSPDQYRAKAQAEEVKKLESQHTSLLTKVENTTQEVKKLESQHTSLSNEVENTAKMVHGTQVLAAKTLRTICTHLQQSGRTTLKHFDILCKLAPPKAKPTTDEMECRNKLEQEISVELPDDLASLQNKADTLHHLLPQVTAAIERVGRKLQKMAKDIPFWRKSRLAEITKLETQIANAEAKAASAITITKWLYNALTKHCELMKEKYSQLELKKMISPETLLDLKARGQVTHDIKIDGIDYTVGYANNALIIYPLPLMTYEVDQYLSEHPDIALSEKQIWDLRTGQDVQLPNGRYIAYRIASNSITAERESFDDHARKYFEDAARKLDQPLINHRIAQTDEITSKIKR